MINHKKKNKSLKYQLQTRKPTAYILKLKFIIIKIDVYISYLVIYLRDCSEVTRQILKTLLRSPQSLVI